MGGKKKDYFWKRITEGIDFHKSPPSIHSKVHLKNWQTMLMRIKKNSTRCKPGYNLSNEKHWIYYIFKHIWNSNNCLITNFWSWWSRQVDRIIVVQSLSHVWLIVTPWTAAHLTFLSITLSQSSLKLMSIIIRIIIF